MQFAEIASAFLFGVAFGSFSNVAIYRVPLGRSTVTPGSYCPSCGKPIAWYDNLPLVSFLVLRARCRNCGQPISIRYPIVELGVGLLWAATVSRFGLTPALPAYLALVTSLVILSAIDLEHHRLPDRLLLPAGIAAGILFLVAAASSGGWSDLGRAGLGALAYFLPMLGIGVIAPAGMGGGDIKLSAYLGLHLGWLGLLSVLVGALAGFLAGGVAGVALLVSRRKGRKDPIPFGPFMAVGTLISVFWGEPILAFWLGSAV